MKTRILVKEGGYKLTKAGVPDAKIDAEELFCFAAGIDKVGLFLKANEEVDEEIEAKFNELIEIRATRIPLQYIIGEQEFMGYKFRVGPNVLIPRQDTELLVGEAARAIQQMQAEPKKCGLFGGRLFRGKGNISVLDLCCGNGAVGISLYKICSDIRVYGTDISPEAIAVAEENAKVLRAKVDFACGDMFDALDAIKSHKKFPKFDMIVSNPPYIKTNLIAMLQDEVKSHEPREALDGGLDGLDYYRIIVEQAADYLKEAGWLMLEIGYDQGEELRKLIRDSGRYTPAEVVKDLPGKDRVVKCRKG